MIDDVAQMSHVVVVVVAMVTVLAMMADNVYDSYSNFDLMIHDYNL
jgi:hypothetical protein